MYVHVHMYVCTTQGTVPVYCTFVYLTVYVQVYVLKRLIAALAKVSAKVSDEHRVPGKSDFWLFTHPTSTYGYSTW